MFPAQVHLLTLIQRHVHTAEAHVGERGVHTIVLFRHLRILYNAEQWRRGLSRGHGSLLAVHQLAPVYCRTDSRVLGHLLDDLVEQLITVPCLRLGSLSYRAERHWLVFYDVPGNTGDDGGRVHSLAPYAPVQGMEAN